MSTLQTTCVLPVELLVLVLVEYVGYDQTAYRRFQALRRVSRVFVDFDNPTAKAFMRAYETRFRCTFGDTASIHALQVVYRALCVPSVLLAPRMQEAHEHFAGATDECAVLVTYASDLSHRVRIPLYWDTFRGMPREYVIHVSKPAPYCTVMREFWITWCMVLNVDSHNDESVTRFRALVVDGQLVQCQVECEHWLWNAQGDYVSMVSLGQRQLCRTEVFPGAGWSMSLADLNKLSKWVLDEDSLYLELVYFIRDTFSVDAWLFSERVQQRGSEVPPLTLKPLSRLVTIRHFQHRLLRLVQQIFSQHICHGLPDITSLVVMHLGWRRERNEMLMEVRANHGLSIFLRGGMTQEQQLRYSVEDYRKKEIFQGKIRSQICWTPSYFCTEWAVFC